MNEKLAELLTEAKIVVSAEDRDRKTVTAAYHEVLPPEEGTDGRILDCAPVQSPVNSCAK